jgi:hypothetical protein
LLFQVSVSKFLGSDIIIKNKKTEDMHTDRCGNTGRQKCGAKEAEKK